MQEKDLILGVLTAQAGFATPAQVLEAASAVLVDRDGPSLVARLEASGVLTHERRALLETMAAAALGPARRAPDPGSIGDATLVSLPSGNADAAEPGSRGKPDRDLPQPSPLVPLEQEGRYDRLGEIGRGGHSVVIRAVDRLIGRQVALKELVTRDGERSTHPDLVAARFLREVCLTAHLDHPGIVTIHDLARRPDGTLVCAQKLIEGETLKTRLARCRSLRDRLRLLPHLIEACEAIAHAHSRGVIHRDLKPSNIMVGHSSGTVVIDWGLAKRRGKAEAGSSLSNPRPSPDPSLTLTGIAVGTPSYMSPEQARGTLEEIDERSDLFGLGAILYELLCGRPPFEGVTTEHVIEKVMAGQIHPVHMSCPDAPPELAAIAARALQPRPDDRYPSVQALVNDLLAYLAGSRVAAYRYPLVELTKKLLGRGWGISVTFGMALLILAGFALLAHAFVPPGSRAPFAAPRRAPLVLSATPAPTPK